MISYIYSGSFNPIHFGHMEIVNKLTSLGGEVILEACSNAYEKESRDEKVLIDQMGDLYRKLDADIKIVSSEYSLFLEKIMYYYLGGCREMVFAVGYDTYERILNSKVGGFKCISNLNNLLEGCDVSFLVFQRDDLKATEPHELVHDLSFDSFSDCKCNVRSSDIRANKAVEESLEQSAPSIQKNNPKLK